MINPSLKPIRYIPLAKPGLSTSLLVQPVLTRQDSNLIWWNTYIQPTINAMPRRADQGWRWQRIMFGALNKVAAAQQFPQGYAITLPDWLDQNGHPIVCGLVYTVRHYHYVGHPYLSGSYLWYWASAPKRVLSTYAPNIQSASPMEIEPCNIGRIAIDLTIQTSIAGFYEGRMGLKADLRGRQVLIDLYQKEYGMMRLTKDAWPPTVARSLLDWKNSQQYFYFDDAGAMEFSKKLTSWR